MSKRGDGLLTDMLAHNCSATASPNAGTTCTANVAPVAGSHEKIHLTNLGWSIRNVTAAAFTATLNVRDATIGGTVLATWDIVIGANAGLQDSWAVNIMGLRGNAVNVDFGAPAASVTQKVSVQGWRQISDD